MSFQAHIQRFADHSNTLLVGKFVAVASIGIYAGNAFFYSNALMPALAKFSTASSVAVWSEIFHKVKGTQITSMALGALSGAGLFYKTDNRFYLYSAAIMASLIPYTSLLLVPVSKKLLDIRKHNKDDGTADILLRRWSKIHFGRTLLGFAALFSATYGLITDGAEQFIIRFDPVF
ncbi:hypothetical protein BGZ93_006479 [Podila epicladia]|nr:hypothetical protein BGZ93_006479 [Podila epicladia]